MKVRFAKVEGLGNDFVLVDARRDGIWIRSETAVRWCDRRRGIGADGVLTLLPSEPAAARMHIYNADGSEPEMCGNGLRCAVAAVSGEASGARVTLDTPAGPRWGRRVATDRVAAGLGAARRLGRIADLDVDGALEPGWAVSVGNPHLVVWLNGDPQAAAARHGPRLVAHRAFPGGVNVGFARARPDGTVDLVVHERGSGVTLACGTGAAAAAASAVASGRAVDVVRVELPGGPCRVEVGPPDPAGEGDRPITLEGPAHEVFEGEIAIVAADIRQRV